MQRSATFADLPVELAERVILVISHRWTVEDKPSLANLARASRAIHRLVQPILVRSVVMTDSNVSKIRAVAHLFRSTRALIIQDPDFAQLGLTSDFYRCTTSFPNLDLYVGPYTALSALMRYINPERIVASAVIELNHLFASAHIHFQRFSRLTHLRIASRMWPPVSSISLLVTHLFLDLVDLDLDYEDDMEEEHARVAKALASLVVPARLPKLERVCLRISDSARAMPLRKGLESYPPLQGETRLWLAVPEDEHPEFRDPYEDQYWLVGSQVHCGS